MEAGRGKRHAAANSSNLWDNKALRACRSVAGSHHLSPEGLAKSCFEKSEAMANGSESWPSPYHNKGYGVRDPRLRRGAYPANRAAMTEHLFTVDVEEYFHVAALEPYAPRERWHELESRLLQSMDSLLDMLARYGATGTFFTLGIVAERYPELIERIANAGHEVASHGWSHKRVTALSPREFRDEVARSRDLLSSLSGQPVIGYRAPNFSIVPGFEWAYDILIEEGYKYDSSVFPGRQSGRGEQRRGAWRIERTKGELTELPMTCVRFGSMRLPSAGGAWFRLFPFSMTRRALRQSAEAGIPGVFYIHPWEIDADQPRLTSDVLTRIRHYGGLSVAARRMEQMLAEFKFISAAEWFARQPGGLVGVA